MIHVRDSILIGQPVSEVYAFLCRYEHDPLWRTGVLSMKQSTPGPAQVGMQTQEVMQLLGQQTKTTARIVASEPNRRTAFESIEGPVKVWGQRLFEAQGTGTLFTYELHLKLSGVMRFVSPVIQVLLQRQVARDLVKVKQRLEESN